MKVWWRIGWRTRTERAGETVEELVVQVHFSEGVAIRTVPKPLRLPPGGAIQLPGGTCNHC